MPLNAGDCVSVDTPNGETQTNPLYRSEGEVAEVIEDDAATSTGDDRESVVYRARLDTGNVRDFRWRNLRPKP